jgi:hypothetical protein
MPFEFRNLDEQTRRFMTEEIEVAGRNDNLYFSKRFNSAGITSWPALLLEAAQSYNEHWLAYQLETRGLMKGMGTEKGTGYFFSGSQSCLLRIKLGIATHSLSLFPALTGLTASLLTGLI